MLQIKTEAYKIAQSFCLCDSDFWELIGEQVWEIKGREGQKNKARKNEGARERSRGRGTEERRERERESQLTYFNFLHWAIYFFGLFVPLSSGLNIFLVEILF